MAISKSSNISKNIVAEIFTENNFFLKYGEKFTIPCETSPKIGITSNNPTRRANTSSYRRHHVVEFNPYWTTFYDFGFQFFQEYLKNELYSPLRENYKRKQLLKVMSDHIHN